MSMGDRYGVQVGDDGYWLLETGSLEEARRFAVKLSVDNDLGRSQLVDFDSGKQESYRDGECITPDRYRV